MFLFKLKRPNLFEMWLDMFGLAWRWNSGFFFTNLVLYLGYLVMVGYVCVDLALLIRLPLFQSDVFVCEHRIRSLVLCGFMYVLVSGMKNREAHFTFAVEHQGCSVGMIFCSRRCKLLPTAVLTQRVVTMMPMYQIK
uniref:Uncharacterized protein n=1 Tax=Setaria italica TaxID=4555 RepID=K3YLA5_SETIT